MAGVLLVYSLLTTLSRQADVACLRTSASLRHTSPKWELLPCISGKSWQPNHEPQRDRRGKQAPITLIDSAHLKRGCGEGGMLKKKMQLTAICGAKKTHFKMSGIYACPFQTLYRAFDTRKTRELRYLWHFEFIFEKVYRHIQKMVWRQCHL